MQIHDTWAKEETKYGYDFWYQPRINAMISTGWGAPKAFSKVGGGFGLLARHVRRQRA